MLVNFERQETMTEADGQPRHEEYSKALIDFLEVLWGEGYLSPGGAAEVARVLDNLDLAGKSVLDIGCGSGGIALSLAADYGAARVVGIDVEQSVLGRTRARAAARGLSDKVIFQKVEPGPLPFPEGCFDFVFSKDAIVHVPDKTAVFADVYRVLKPSGWFAASDWLISHDEEPSPQMKHYVEQEGLSFGMASPEAYRRALQAAGFRDIRLTDRNPWYCEQAAAELALLEGDLYDRAVAAAGRDVVDHNIGTWRAMLVVLRTGEHCPHHLRGRKPAQIL
ncbi:MAG TPA: methyltransferase domain-containing protein [Aestuariivirgaceae bacterium]|nr:methyltransferase domain-containing protein [Aestuariivirgaceae bacterium]